MKKKRNPLLELEFSAEAASRLRGRQSVRTTFKLTERSIHALSILARQMGIKQKSLFDHLIDDNNALQMIAKESAGYERNDQRIAKTYVISRKTLDNLERVSTRYQAPRDALVELSIERIIPLILKEKEKHAQRKKVMKKLISYLNTGHKLLEETEELLGEDDLVFLKTLEILHSVQTGCEEVSEFIEKGKRMEQF
jgi:hypothetical protein